MSAEVIKTFEHLSPVSPQQEVAEVEIQKLGIEPLIPVLDFAVRTPESNTKATGDFAEVGEPLARIPVVSEGPVTKAELANSQIIYQPNKIVLVEGIIGFKPEMYRRPGKNGLRERKRKEKRVERRQEKIEDKRKKRNGTQSALSS